MPLTNHTDPALLSVAGATARVAGLADLLPQCEGLELEGLWLQLLHLQLLFAADVIMCIMQMT